MSQTINYVKIGKFSVRDSTGLPMSPYNHHFIQLKNPILIGPKHTVLAFSTISRRSNRTGAIVSNEIRFVKLAKLRKDGSISKIQKWDEFNFSSGKIDKEGFQHFHDTFKLSEEYQAYHDMQVNIGTDMYSEYKFSMPEFHLNDIAMEVYLKLRSKGMYNQEEARLTARNRMLEVRTAFLGNDPIIGLSDLSPKQQDVSHELISSQLGKVNRIRHRILHEHPMNIDFTDHNELREESEKLARLRRGFIK
jgi:hypothetical protein